MAPAEKPLMCYRVDNEPSTRDNITDVLSRTNVKSVHFDSVEAMLERYTLARPDLIVIDVTMSSSESGRDLAMLVAANVDCPIRIISGLNSLLTEALRRNWESSGLKILPVLVKPSRQHAIKQAVFDLVRCSLDQPRITASDVIDNGWLELWYQPRIDLNSKVLAGAEAVFRARHPKLGIIPASELMEAANEADLLSLTTRALRRAVNDWKAFQQIGFSTKISINVPICALRRLSLFSFFWEYGPGEPDWPGITLELKEDEIAADMSVAFTALKELRVHKISLAIDSIGANYAELSRYQELPFSEIKIDRSFVRNCGHDPLNASVCETTIDFGHRHGAKIVADGVETPEELKALRRMGCDYGQGFMLAPAMCKSDFVVLLQQRSHKIPASQVA
jgi:EAL domain-containing protein (putative c-di-GMP-specific phosphodiesterase class I)